MLTGALVLGLVLVAGYVRFVRGVPVIDEWHCSGGEAPVLVGEAGQVCAEMGTDLPPGQRWHPLGNRPFSCEGRWGWMVVNDGTEEDCLRDGRPLPEGWTVGGLPD